MNSENSINTSWNFLKGFETSLHRGGHHAAFPSGIEMISMDFTTDSTSKHYFSIDQAPVIFSFQISGHTQGEVAHSIIRSKRVAGGPGKAIISYYPESLFRSKLYERQHYKFVNIYIAPCRLWKILDEELDQVPAEVCQILLNSVQQPYDLILNMPPHVRMTVHQIFNCPYRGVLKRLYLESKSMELIISLLWEAKHVPLENRKLQLRHLDRERIHFAKEILLSDMGNPPSLHELAKKTGLNEHKLNRGFKQEFGTTVYKLYQVHRIEESKDILDEGRLNIDETAYLLGFSDTTHFINHFKNYFGTTPGAYLKNSQSRQ